MHHDLRELKVEHYELPLGMSGEEKKQEMYQMKYKQRREQEITEKDFEKCRGRGRKSNAPE